MTAAKRVLRYLCSTSGMGLVLGGRRPVVLTGHADASWADDQATQRSSQGYTFSLGSGSVSWRSTRSSSVLSSSCEAEIYAGAMAAQELHWLTYLLTDLGEQPRSPPVLYVDNKAMLALCREHRLEHRTKHISLRYFLARELQQRGQLRLAYVASEANTADIFTKALPPGDHQRFSTMLDCVVFLLVPNPFASSIIPVSSQDIPTSRSYAEAITSEYTSYWQTAMDAEMASWKSTVTYVDEVPPSRANIVDGMWIFIVKRPPGSPLAFKAHYVARGFSQCQGVNYFQTFSPTPKMTTLRVLLHVAVHRDFELHSLDFSTDFLHGSLYEETWLRRPPGFTGSFPVGNQWSLRQPIYSLRQVPCEWHDTLRMTLAALAFAPLIADPSLFLCTGPSLPLFYILVYIDDLVFATANTEALTLVKAELQKRHTCTDLGPSTLHLSVLLATAYFSAYRPLGLSSTFGQVLRAKWSRSTRSSSVLGSNFEAKIYVGAKAACWLTDLGERPRSPPVLYVDNPAMIALFPEQRLEHRTKHIALR
ncbi:unnamed protein product [Closterium sp. NIES-54]